jgi:MFS family permease
LRAGATGGRRLLGTAFELAGDVSGKVRRGLESTLGGPARTQVIVLLALVLALSSADTSTVGASATELRQALHIDNTDIGLLVSVTGAVGAIASLPFGVLVDRSNRIKLLVAAMLLWGATMLASAAVSTFGALMLVRVFLGVITALAGPAVASLIGDYFPSAERGKIYGYVLGGELIGAGVGFFITGDVAAISWRAAFVVLAIPAFALAWQVRKLPEPARGGASHLMPGSTVFVTRQQAKQQGVTIADLQTPVPGEQETTDAQKTAQQRGIKPDPELILRTDPRKMNILAAARYVLRVRTNVILILSSACAYFFLTGIQTFGLEFVGDQYGVHTILANLLMLVIGAGAVGGVLVGGRLGDDLIRRGYISGRVLVAGVAAIATVVLFIPPLLTRSPFTALPYVAAAAFCLTAQNPPLDAARLDIMVPLLWGRAEGIRTFLRTAAQSAAPVAFGGLSDLLGNNHSSLRTTFLVMLLPLAASGLILLRGIRYYPTDVATAAASLAASEDSTPAPTDAPERPPRDDLSG